MPSQVGQGCERQRGVVSRLTHQAGCMDASSDGLHRQRRRDRETVAYVAKSSAGDRDVDGQHQRFEPGGGRALHQILAGGAVLPDVELEPFARIGRRGGDVLDRGRAHRGQRVRDADRSATFTTALSPSWFIIRVKPVGANANGSSERLAEDRRPRSISETSRRIDGCNSISANRWRARRRLISASAAPSV